MVEWKDDKDFLHYEGSRGGEIFNWNFQMCFSHFHNLRVKCFK